MGGIAQFERGLIRKRCEEGIERAERKGTKFGRPTALDASQKRKITERYAAGETMAELAAQHKCGEATIWRALAIIFDPATDSQSATRGLATGCTGRLRKAGD